MYPDIPQLARSTREAIFPQEWSRALDGRALGVSLGDRTRYRWKLQHACTQAQWDALNALFDSTQSVTGAGNGTFQFNDDEQEQSAATYTCQFLRRPRIREKLNAGRFLVESEFAEVA